ncbi:MAG: 3-phosphoshikimate 1-carboxyvinyltransferase [Nitrososphaerota archaeon]|nr:3-phosphoshikimate 1-carboxyvinyltransferase [Aigarchaeota archaeon]MDW8076612.1 3-phosphoshikimate 1-carboxyvinyltransferase [Nitrososphaerota archaeon]
MLQVLVRPSTISGRVRAPPSKSYSHRAIIAASMTDGECVVENVSKSDDVLATINACKKFGASIIEENDKLIVSGFSVPKAPDDVVNVQNSGTTLRIMTGVSCLVQDGYVVLTGDESIRRRPMQPLLDALNMLGGECWSTRLNGCAPIVVKGSGLKGGNAWMIGNVSSQFVSSILFSSPKALNDTTLTIQGDLVSRPYVDATIKVLERFGVSVEREEYKVFHIPSQQNFKPARFTVPGDFGLASFMMAAALMTDGSVTVEGLSQDLPQADAAIVDILTKMGANIKSDYSYGRVTVSGSGKLEGGSFNLSDFPDLLPVLAVLTTRCEGTVEITGVEHARVKESDRVSALAHALSKVGMNVKEMKDGLSITRGKLVKHAVLDPKGDHRLFMAYCLLGLVLEEGCTVLGAESANVSYPNFLRDLTSLGASIHFI